MEEVERRAEAVLERVPDWLWNGERLPVPVEDIADTCFGLLVRDVEDLSRAPGAPPLDGGQLSGLLLAGPGEIWVNAGEGRSWPPRRRFTIGHELGHWELHRPGARGAVFCRHASVAEGEAEAGPDAVAVRPPVPEPEEEANVFAAALLMPAHLIRRYYRPNGDFHELCRRFGASGAAMGRRLHAVI